MTGRRTIAGVLAVAAAVVVTALVWSPRDTPDRRQASERDEGSEQDQPRPNVLIIVTDDQRADHTLGVMPEVDRWFLRGGVRFSQAFATTPLCCPSRASIFTGRYTHNHNVLNNAKPGASRLDQTTTLQHYLKEEEYTTGLFGKYLNSWDVRQTPPNFDRWALMHHGYHDAEFNVQGRMKTIPGSSTDYIAQQTVSFIESLERQDERPWFAYVAVHASHTGFEPSPRYVGAPVPRWSLGPDGAEEDETDKPPYVQAVEVAPGDADQIRKDQLRTLMSVDDLVGDVFATLERASETGHTLAFFMSDNGFFWGEHGLTDKRLPYVQSTRIPLLMRWPGHVTAGTVDSRLVANIDIAPTVLSAAGVEPNHVVDGRPLLSTTQRKQLLLEYMLDPGYEVPPWAALHSKDRQYAEYYGKNKVVFRELYDLTRDEGQLRNLMETSAHERTAARLHLELRRLRSCSGTEGSQACP
jgi:arylsulfatase A-like enzyme